jgi:hypothetical protein
MRFLDGLRGRRSDATTEEPPSAPTPDADQEQPLQRLHERIDHLELTVRDLQDSTHRQFVLHAKRLDDLSAKTDPHRLAQALSEDARRRGTS